MSATLPKLVLDMTYAHDAWIVGSAANPEITSPRDYDVLVPFSQWQKACMLIPKEAVRNHFGGWKCISEGIEVDVWPADLSWIMQRPMLKFIWHPATGIRWTKI